MSTFWIVFVLLFIVGPVARWGMYGGVWGPRAVRRWRALGWSGYDGPINPGDRQQLDDVLAALEQRNQDVEWLQARVTELENRVDFAERLLADRRPLSPLAGERVGSAASGG